MADNLHIRFDDGTEICVPESEAGFIIEKYRADGCDVKSMAECDNPRCAIRAGINLAPRQELPAAGYTLIS